MEFDFLTVSAITAFLQVMAINLVLSGDNAIVIGLAAAGLPAEQRNKAILFGMIAATVLRIVFAAIATHLLDVVGLLLVGGLLLAWVCWKMWSELREQAHARTHAEEALHGTDIDGDGVIGGPAARKTFAQAAQQIVIADVSMSLDNVLAVAGAARSEPVILIIGLVFSIALMGIAATFIATLLNRFPALAYIGLAVIVYVAIEMIVHGSIDVWPFVQPHVETYLPQVAPYLPQAAPHLPKTH